MAEGFIGQRTAHGYPKWKVYIFGLDVTKDIASIVTNTSDVGRAPSTCEMVLSNLGDKYIVTDKDIASMYGDIDLEAVRALVEEELAAKYASSEARELAAPKLISNAVTAKVKERLEANVHIREKLLVLEAKVGERAQGVVMQSLAASLNGASVTPSGIAAMTGDACRYPFQSGDCIFHSNDAVRVFLRDPLTLEWYFGFSGYLTDWVDSVDKDNKRIVTIRCEDVLRIFRYARVTTNPGLVDAAKVRTAHDALYRTFFSESFAKLSLPEFIHLITFGLSRTQLGAAVRQRAGLAREGPGFSAVEPFSDIRMGVEGDRTQIAVMPDGIGSFNFRDSKLFTWGPPPKKLVTQPQASLAFDAQLLPVQPQTTTVSDVKVSGKNFEQVKSLGEYQAVVDHKVQVNDLVDMLVQGDAKASAALETNYLPQVQELSGEDAILKVIDIIGRHPGHYPVDFGRLIMLLPGCLGTDLRRDLITQDLISSVASKTMFKTRLAMIYDICQRVEFSFYATPKGDILCEMPLYDFDPRDFGLETVRKSNLTFSAEEVYGPYGPRYSVSEPETLSWERTFSDEQIRTQVRSQHFIIAGYTGIGTSDQIWQLPGVATLDTLLPQFGARLEDVDPQGPIVTPEGAAAYAMLKLNQLNANARTARIQAHIALGLGPNRPVLFEPRSQVMTLRTITYSITWGMSGSVGMSLTTNYVRGWSGQIVAGRRIYEPIGGMAGRTLNYAVLFQPRHGGGSGAAAAAVVAPTSTKQKSKVARSSGGQSSLVLHQNLSDVKALVANAMSHAPNATTSSLDDVIEYHINSDYRPGDVGSAHADALAADVGPGHSNASREEILTIARRLDAWDKAGGFPEGTRIILEGPSFGASGDIDGIPMRTTARSTGNHVHIEFPQNALTSYMTSRRTPEDRDNNTPEYGGPH